MVVLFLQIFASQSQQKFPLQYTAIYSNENITKITKLSHHEYPHLVQNGKSIYMKYMVIIQYLFKNDLFDRENF